MKIMIRKQLFGAVCAMGILAVVTGGCGNQNPPPAATTVPTTQGAQSSAGAMGTPAAPRPYGEPAAPGNAPTGAASVAVAPSGAAPTGAQSASVGPGQAPK